MLTTINVRNSCQLGPSRFASTFRTIIADNIFEAVVIFSPIFISNQTRPGASRITFGETCPARLVDLAGYPNQLDNILPKAMVLLSVLSVLIVIKKYLDKTRSSSRHAAKLL